MTRLAADALCPSSPATPGARLTGVIEPGGRVANLPTPLPIDANFIDQARAGGPLEKRFRFSSPCVEGRCGYWTGHECGLIGKLHEAIVAQVSEPSLPACAIRAECRWWRQRGRDACAICAFVVTGSEGAPGGYIST